MSLLYETARSFAGFMDRESLYREAHEVMTTRLDIALEIWEPDSTNGFIRMNHALANADPALMQLAVDHHRPTGWGVSGFLCLGRLFQGQPNEAALCFL